MKCKYLDQNSCTPSATQICNRNTVKLYWQKSFDTAKVLATEIKELKHQFQTHFRMTVGQFKASSEKTELQALQMIGDTLPYIVWQNVSLIFSNSALCWEIQIKNFSAVARKFKLEPKSKSDTFLPCDTVRCSCPISMLKYFKHIWSLEAFRIQEYGQKHACYGHRAWNGGLHQCPYAWLAYREHEYVAFSPYCFVSTSQLNNLVSHREIQSF